MQHVTYELNEEGRDFVVGDIHGCLEQFKYEMVIIDFDYNKDRMFSVGDLTDRGPNSFECLQLIENPWFHAVRGNHEDMMIKGFIDKDWEQKRLFIMNGGDWYKHVDEVQLLKYVAKAAGLPLAITVKTKIGKVGICHAEPPTDDWSVVDDLSKANMANMIWGRDHIEYGGPITKGVVRTYHGHTPIKNPKVVGNAHFIDTGAFVKERDQDTPYRLTIVEIK